MFLIYRCQLCLRTWSGQHTARLGGWCDDTMWSNRPIYKEQVSTSKGGHICGILFLPTHYLGIILHAEDTEEWIRDQNDIILTSCASLRRSSNNFTIILLMGANCYRTDITKLASCYYCVSVHVIASYVGNEISWGIQDY